MFVVKASTAETAVDRLRTAVDELLALDLTQLDRDDLLALCTGVETQLRRTAAADTRLIAELDTRHVAGDLGARSTAALLQQLLRISPGMARARVAAAGDFGPRHALTGEPLPPLFPAVAAAQAAGEIAPAHAHVIAEAITALPASIEFEHGRTLEVNLVEQARHLDPVALGRQVRLLLERLDPDGAEPDDRDQQRHRELHLRCRADGSADLHGRLTPWAAATWATILDSLSAPAPAEDGTPDDRTAAQRRHDALLDAGQRLLRCADLPDTGGAPVTIVLRMTATDLATGRGYAHTEHGQLIAVPDVLARAGDGAVLPVLLDPTGGIVSYGRTQRLASAAQRRALTVRDGGCSFPGCTIPASWCETHHVVSWADGGGTDIANLTLLCGHHHRNFERRGWDCDMSDAVPRWRPPAWLDPDRTPRRNTAHHTELLLTPPQVE